MAAAAGAAAAAAAAGERTLQAEKRGRVRTGQHAESEAESRSCG